MGATHREWDEGDLNLFVKPSRRIEILCNDKKINGQKAYLNCDKLA